MSRLTILLEAVIHQLFAYHPHLKKRLRGEAQCDPNDKTSPPCSQSRFEYVLKYHIII